jgi:hypothetical protein
MFKIVTLLKRLIERIRKMEEQILLALEAAFSPFGLFLQVDYP